MQVAPRTTLPLGSSFISTNVNIFGIIQTTGNQLSITCNEPAARRVWNACHFRQVLVLVCSDQGERSRHIMSQKPVVRLQGNRIPCECSCAQSCDLALSKVLQQPRRKPGGARSGIPCKEKKKKKAMCQHIGCIIPPWESSWGTPRTCKEELKTTSHLPYIER